MNRRIALLTLAGAAVESRIARATPRNVDDGNAAHIKWVDHVLARMMSVKSGMTRSELLSAFTTEGGISTALEQTYVSRDCPYFKVDVTFKIVGRPEKDAEGRVTATEDGGDIIATISRPYLAYSICD